MIDVNFKFDKPTLNHQATEEQKIPITDEPAEITAYECPKGGYTHKVVPFRDDNGALHWGYYESTRFDKTLFELWDGTLWSKRQKYLSTGRAGYSMRYEKFSMKKPLAIVMSANVGQRFKQPEKVFQDIIESILFQEGYKGQLKLGLDGDDKQNYLFVSRICMTQVLLEVESFAAQNPTTDHLSHSYPRALSASTRPISSLIASTTTCTTSATIRRRKLPRPLWAWWMRMASP